MHKFLILYELKIMLQYELKIMLHAGYMKLATRLLLLISGILNLWTILHPVQKEAHQRQSVLTVLSVGILVARGNISIIIVNIALLPMVVARESLRGLNVIVLLVMWYILAHCYY